MVAQGLFQCFTVEEVRGLVVEAAACTSPGSRFVFTHAKPGYRKLVTFLTGLVAEPRKSAVKSEDLPEYVEGTGSKTISEGTGERSSPFTSDKPPK